MEILAYISSYFMIGIIFSFLFDVLNDHFSHPDDEDKVEFDWIMRIITILLWPYILGVFIRSLIDNYNVPKLGDVIYDDELGECEVIDELPPEEEVVEK